MRRLFRKARWVNACVPTACALLLASSAAKAQTRPATQSAQTAPATTRSTAPVEAQVAALAGAEQRVFADALRIVAPSIVRIDTVGGAQAPREGGASFRQADGSTTGVIWSADGWILTSSINFVRDPLVITVTLADGRSFVARLVARDRPARLALLKVEAGDLPAARPVASETLRVGQWMLAAGWGYGGPRPALSVGVLSARGRVSGMALQTDAKTSPANYGGPLFDVDGRVAGVCVPLAPGDASDLAGIEWYDSGIGFAIHADFIRARLPRLMRGETLVRGLLGIDLVESPAMLAGAPDESADAGGEPSSRGTALEAPPGALPELPPGAPAGPRIARAPHPLAESAGLRTGDVLLRIDDESTPGSIALRRALARRAAGDAVRVTLWRTGETLDVTCRLYAESELAAPATAPAPASAPIPASAPATAPGS